MKVTKVEVQIVNVPYKHQEVSAVVARDGVTDILIKITTDDGLVGWGEGCSGADAESVAVAARAMIPFVLGRNPWNREAIQAELYYHGLWQFRAMTANFAWAGIDMALWDICGQAAGQPLYNFFGGLRRQQVSYFYYLVRSGDLEEQCAAGLAAGYEDFYVKVGVDFDSDYEIVSRVRAALGSKPRLRIDANAAWSVPQAIRTLRALEPFDIDFVEQPVREYPLRQMAEVRANVTMPLAANEGLWTQADAYASIRERIADVYCFSPYWVGSLAGFHRLAWVAHYEGLQVVKHTHGELGIAAAACHHLLLTLPNIVTGHQQTAQHMVSDVLRTPLPIKDGPLWGIPQGTGLCIDVDDNAVAAAATRYKDEGQYKPYSDAQLRQEER